VAEEKPTTFSATIKVHLYKTSLFLAQHIGEAKDGDKVYRLSMNLGSGSLIINLPNGGGDVLLHPADLLSVARAIERGELKPE
jgi:hypothetical protein